MRSQRGSIVLFALFVCLGVAVLVQILSTVVIVSHRAIAEEDAGRRSLAEEAVGLAAVRQRLVGEWSAMPWSPLDGVDGVEARVTGIPNSEGWALAAAARLTAGFSSVVVSAWIERGRDGLDLPLAGLVADRVELASGRESPWLRIVGEDESRVCLRVAPGLEEAPPEGVTVMTISDRWRLDKGWRALVALPPGAQGLGLSSHARAAHAVEGSTVRPPAGWGAAGGDPWLLVITGGGSLDARDLGDVSGVVVVDEGDVLLDGTTVHGAVCATGVVRFGASGAVVFSRAALRWATDSALQRTRVVPGSRTETAGS